MFEDQLLNNIHVRAFLIDEGAEIDVPVCHLRPLEQQFSYLPRTWKVNPRDLVVPLFCPV